MGEGGKRGQREGKIFRKYIILEKFHIPQIFFRSLNSSATNFCLRGGGMFQRGVPGIPEGTARGKEGNEGKKRRREGRAFHWLVVEPRSMKENEVVNGIRGN